MAHLFHLFHLFYFIWILILFLFVPNFSEGLKLKSVDLQTFPTNYGQCPSLSRTLTPIPTPLPNLLQTAFATVILFYLKNFFKFFLKKD